MCWKNFCCEFGLKKKGIYQCYMIKGCGYFVCDVTQRVTEIGVCNICVAEKVEKKVEEERKWFWEEEKVWQEEKDKESLKNVLEDFLLAEKMLMEVKSNGLKEYFFKFVEQYAVKWQKIV